MIEKITLNLAKTYDKICRKKLLVTIFSTKFWKNLRFNYYDLPIFV